MAPVKLSKADLRLIDELVEHYENNIAEFNRLLGYVQTLFYDSQDLARLVHSMKGRVKKPDHLRGKLIRKARECREKGELFDITTDNLFDKITDLAGFRVLHLHTEQFGEINQVLLGILRDEKWQLVEGPKARVWDEEYKKYFVDLGVEAETNQRLYTSVHYLIKTNNEKQSTCEVQVRTLAEELWGEVDHTINYPQPHSSSACREQIKVLARMTSGCTRLVDSIFRAHQESLLVPKPKAGGSTIEKHTVLRSKK